MMALTQDLYGAGFVLRTGRAKGADAAFLAGYEKGPLSIYQPGELGWQPDERAFEIAARIHPNWNACDEHAQALHARNVHQVLGDDLETPSEFLICWTKKGAPVGGTRTAIMVAQERGIPVYNMGLVGMSANMIRETLNRDHLDGRLCYVCDECVTRTAERCTDHPSKTVTYGSWDCPVQVCEDHRKADS
jgi:Tfp pilus assembly protein PilW